MKVSYRGLSPKIASGAYLAPNVSVIGDVTLEKGVSLWYGAVVRGDQAAIRVGEESNIQDNAVIHVSDALPTVVGRGVTVGHGAILHGCTIEDHCLIGMGAVLLNHCVVGKDSMVAAGAVVPERMVIPPRSLVMGTPAKVRRILSQEEVENIRHSASGYLSRARELLEEQE